MRPVVLLCALLAVLAGRAQKTLTPDELLAVVTRYHPVARRAALGEEAARSNVTAARGAFDPQLRWSTGRKDLDGVTYYDEDVLELKVPTWYGIDLQAGREQRSGERLNPEETRGALSYVGLSIPLGRDLVYDKRRAALQEAQLLVSASTQARRAARNDLQREALDDYWTWWEAQEQLRLADSIRANAGRRLGLVRTAVRLGDRAAIDTVEAWAQVQNITQQRAEAELTLRKARLELSALLWNEAGAPYDLPEDVLATAPEAGSAPMLDGLLAGIGQHPELQAYFLKTASARLQRRLKFQQLLPDVDLKYNALVKGSNPLQGFKALPSPADYRYGLTLAVPLRLSEGRGGWRAARLKVSQAELEAEQKQRELRIKVQQQYVEWQQVGTQVALQEAAARSYTVLLRGEEARLAGGESSLFLVNAREQAAWEARRKGIALQAKQARALVRLRWAAGALTP